MRDGGQYSVAPAVARRTFAPRLWSTVLAIALGALLVALGRWQLARAAEKRALFAEFAAGADATLNLASAGAKPLPRYQHVAAAGHFDGAHQILLDSMTHAEQAGFRVLAPFMLDDGRTILVDRGWIALGGSRTDWPPLDIAPGHREIRGRVDELPVPGVRLPGPATENTASAWPKLMNYPELPELEAALARQLYPRILLLDPGEPDGFVREWRPPGFAPERHIGYAVQWFALALTLAVIYVILNLRKNEST
jgi:surfeit locus 1 family protein